MTSEQLREWARVHITGIDTDTLSHDTIEGIYLRRKRQDAITGTVDRLTARVVWGPSWGSARGWLTLGLAGPRGPLPG